MRFSRARLASRSLKIAAVLSVAGASLALARAPLPGSATAAKGTPAPCGEHACHTFSTARAALAKVLERGPVVLGVGEYHEIEGLPKVRSAIRRFTELMLPSLKGRAVALIAETWMTTGRCGEIEKQAVEAVEKVTRRPETTEDEVTTMLTRSYELGMQNHILVLSCAEYAALLDPDGQLDGERSLLMVREKVQAKAEDLRERELAGLEGKLLILYGGALHNDLYPEPGTEDFSFGPALRSALGPGYLELDLLVPEYVAKDEELKKQPWFAGAMKLAASGKTVLLEPKPGAWVLLFPRTR